MQNYRGHLAFLKVLSGSKSATMHLEDSVFLILCGVLNVYLARGTSLGGHADRFRGLLCKCCQSVLYYTHFYYCIVCVCDVFVFELCTLLSS